MNTIEDSKDPLFKSECEDQVRRSINFHKRENTEEDWWPSESASSTASYYSDSDRSTAEWESVIESTGEVFYVESIAADLCDRGSNNYQMEEEPVVEFVRRRSVRTGKFMQFIRRKESKRFNNKNKKATINNLTCGNEDQEKKRSGCEEVKFEDFQTGEVREITLHVDPERRHKLGRRASFCEAYFGIIPGVSSDNVRVIVAGFIPDGEAMKNKDIKIGDWLRNVNSQEVTSQTLECILSTQIVAPTNVTLTLQRIRASDGTDNSSPESNHPKVQHTYNHILKTCMAANACFVNDLQSTLVRRLMDKEASKNLLKSFLDYPLGIIYLRTVDLSETDTDMQGTYYTFPRSDSKHFHPVIYAAKGAFVTLNDLLPEIASQEPVSTTIRVSGKEVHLVYTPRNDELLLLAIPSTWCTLEEAIMLTRDIVSTLEFIYQSLSKCFTAHEHRSFLDHFFCLIMSRLSNTERASLEKIHDELSPIELKYEFVDIESYKFESSFQVGKIVQLPRDAQIQIDAALNEMEAMDYREWNEDPMDCQRLYTILGSCIYHKNYLLGSHLAHEDLIQVHSFLRHSGVLHLVNRETVKCLVSWKRVYPLSCCERNNYVDAQTVDRSLLVPNGKWFLLVVGYGHDLLAALLESGGCTTRYDETIGPDVFYVEEAQETLKHVQKIGVMALADKCIASADSASAVTTSTTNTTAKVSSTIAENLLGLIKPSDIQNEFLSKPNTSEPSPNKKTQEVSSTLKLRSSNESPIISGSMHSLQTSEDSLSQGTGAISEISDEAAPILGRRATREKVNNTASRYSDDSDSDMDICKHDGPTMMTNISSIRENLLNQVGYAIPMKLTTGEKNYLFRCVHLDAAEGIMLSASKPVENSSLQHKLLSNFNKCVHVIHRLLRNTVRFKKMLSQDIDKTVINKSLVAIKEHGILFQWENINYWVVGRLYMSPRPKEMYVCYEDSAPQNLIEIAFRLNCS